MNIALFPNGHRTSIPARGAQSVESNFLLLIACNFIPLNPVLSCISGPLKNQTATQYIVAVFFAVENAWQERNAHKNFSPSSVAASNKVTVSDAAFQKLLPVRVG